MVEKFKIKLNQSELDVLYQVLQVAISMNPEQMITKVYVAEMVDLYKKVLLKWTCPKEMNTVVMTAAQAISFYLLFNSYFNSNIHTHITINTICNTIHKQYC